MPETTIDSGPPDVTGDTTPTFTFSASEPSATFECSVDWTAPWFPCTSPYTMGPLGPGLHGFSVRARTSAGTDETAAGRTFTITGPSTPPPAAPAPARGRCLTPESR